LKKLGEVKSYVDNNRNLTDPVVAGIYQRLHVRRTDPYPAGYRGRVDRGTPFAGSERLVKLKCLGYKKAFHEKCFFCL